MDTYYNDLLAQLRGMYITARPDVAGAERIIQELAMTCEYCGGNCTIYDGGEANNYELSVWVCDDCEAWQEEDADEDGEEAI